jgi:hypothetical protein
MTAHGLEFNPHRNRDDVEAKHRQALAFMGLPLPPVTTSTIVRQPCHESTAIFPHNENCLVTVAEPMNGASSSQNPPSTSNASKTTSVPTYHDVNTVSAPT